MSQMELRSRNNNIADIPDEIFLKIFSFISTCDLINFCKAYPEKKYFLCERQLIRRLNFWKSYQLKPDFGLTDFMYRKINPQHVTHLNMNGLYWVSAEEIRKCLKRFVNLESLYVLDTKLYLSDKTAGCLAALTKLKKIALCLEVNNYSSGKINSLPAVKKLMVHMFCSDFIQDIKDISKRSSLEELWIVDRGEFFHADVSHFLTGKNLKKLVIKSYSPLTVHNVGAFNMKKTYENKRLGFICLERVESTKPTVLPHPQRSFEYDEHYKKFEKIWGELHCSKPYGVRDAIRIGTREFHFEELNFCHECHSCCRRYFEAVKSCLTSATTRRLKKLSIPLCLFKVATKESAAASAAKESPKKDPPKESPKEKRDNRKENIDLFSYWCQQLESDWSDPSQPPPKRRMVSLDREAFIPPSRNFNYLKELEVWPPCCFPNNCASQTSPAVTNFEHIKYFSNLTKLTLEVNQYCKGDFISDVLKYCKKIETLRISSRYNEPFINALCKSFKFANNLLDFRLETAVQLHIDKLMEGLNQNKGQRLQRVVLKSKSSKKFTSRPLTEFLAKNPQIIFFYIVMKEFPESTLRKITVDMKKFRNTSLKVLLANSMNYHVTVPLLHHNDMVLCESRVAVPDIYNDFVLET